MPLRFLLLPVLLLAAADDLSVYRGLDQSQRLRPHDPTATRAWLDEAARLATRAADLIETKRFAEAAALLRATERPLGGAPSWNNLRGYAEFKLNNPKTALHYLQRALHLDPASEEYLLDLGEFLGHHRAYEEAVRVFEVAAKRMPSSPRVAFGLALSYVLLNRRDHAQQVLVSLIQSHPGFEPAYKALGEVYEDAGNAAALVGLGETLQKLNPRNAQGWYMVGAGSLLAGRMGASSLDEAVSAFQRALQIDPSHTRARFLLARALQESGRGQEAIAHLKETLRLDPGHERAHYMLARLYQKRGDQKAARDEFARHSQIKQQERNSQYRRLLINMREP